MHMYMQIYTDWCVYAYVRICMFMDGRTEEKIDTYVYERVCVYVYIQTYINMYTYIYTYI